MAVTYTCPTCGAKMAVDEAVESLKCPVCRIPMHATAAESSGDVPSTPATGSTGLKVARPVHHLGELCTHGSSPPGGETHATGPLAQEMAKLAETSRKQAEKEAEELLEKARLQAEREMEEIRRQLEAELQEEVATVREEHLAEARQEAAHILEQARAEAKEAAAHILDEARQQAEEMRETTVRQTETEAREAKEALVEEAKKLAREARKKAETIEAEAAKEAERKVSRALREAREKLLLEAEDLLASTRQQAEAEAATIREKALLEAKRLNDDTGKAADTKDEKRDPSAADSPKAKENAADNTAKNKGEPSRDKRIQELEEENERVKLSFARQARSEKDAKEGALHSANEVHRVQFRISLLLRLMGPLLLFYGLFMIAKTDEISWRAAAIGLFGVSLGLSFWGMLLGLRLKKHVDGLFEFFFDEQLRGFSKASKDGAPPASTSASAEPEATPNINASVTVSQPTTKIRFGDAVAGNGRGKRPPKKLRVGSTKRSAQTAEGEDSSERVAEKAEETSTTDEPGNHQSGRKPPEVAEATAAPETESGAKPSRKAAEMATTASLPEDSPAADGTTPVARDGGEIGPA